MAGETTARRRPTGRRAGDSGTRDAILDAALALFAEHGYDGASLRAIAGAAGVDPALVRHFFGDKETLFATAVADRTTIPLQVLSQLGGDPSSAGRALTTAYLRVWEDPGTRPVVLALVRSATASPRAAEMLRDTLMSRAADQPGMTPERLRHIALAAAHLFGVAVARHVLKARPIADLTVEELVDEVAPTIQRYLTGTHRGPDL
ncbi:TetR/AcrR family transcriptional regulator [Cellulomonas carbonis]|uniref:TetR family transcriptional regulator n=1 Tax=Cellulomonas carbonis T26 TaxID=947969 RepID=A0A0A0BUF1_9CELL|nr:TetR family transcriptional regulator [Cellulomonas carbonis]KGM12048.1 TetR family transcriptional regulator [Cellulomonas carbonis T26]GGC08032.1 TetR family transcriptional regulator [Cellulomonas carbonis]